MRGRERIHDGGEEFTEESIESSRRVHREFIQREFTGSQRIHRELFTDGRVRLRRRFTGSSQRTEVTEDRKSQRTLMGFTEDRNGVYTGP